MKKAFINWSSGKDAAYALYRLRSENEYSIEKLLTTVNTQSNAVSMHGVKMELLQKQAEALGIPLQIISIPGEIPAEKYNRIMQKEISGLVSQGFSHSVFGDIFLEDVRKYRERQLEQTGLKAVFPLWGRNTTDLIREFIESGFKAITVSVNAKLLDSSFCGRILDQEFLSDLPAGIDPCGENGEFHTFVYDGPGFKKPVEFKKGRISEKIFRSSKNVDHTWDNRFLYCELLPV